jgi:hypothetical protein
VLCENITLNLFYCTYRYMNVMLDYQHNTIRQRKRGERRESREGGQGRAGRRAEQRRGE